MPESASPQVLRILLLNQCFHPDHVSTAQHLTDLALGLAERGHQVTVVASSRGYDNPAIRYPARETWRGIDIRRIWVPGLGKGSKWRRAIDFGMFWVNAIRLLTFLPRFDVTVCLTSPPLISFAGSLAAALKGGAVVPWVMDLNPDEAVAAGWLKSGGAAHRILAALQDWSFKRARGVVALDRFMAKRLTAKGVPQSMIHVDAPWSHDDAVHFDPEGREAFRAEHGLAGKYVIMYSGNHSPCHPLDPLLQAAEALRNDEHIHFLFAGGGSQFPLVQKYARDRGLKNILTLPYQPLGMLSRSLSAADLHVVVMGQPFVGIVHPCKIYNILTLGLPFLAIGPDESHLRDLAARVQDSRYALAARPDDAASLTKILRGAAARGPLPPSAELREIGREYSRSVLLPRLVSLIERSSEPNL